GFAPERGILSRWLRRGQAIFTPGGLMFTQHIGYRTLTLRVLVVAVVAMNAGSTLASPCDPVVEALDTGVNGAVHAMASVKRGETHQLYIAGKFMTAGEQVVNHIAMWDGNGWNAYRFLPFDPP